VRVHTELIKPSEIQKASKTQGHQSPHPNRDPVSDWCLPGGNGLTANRQVNEEVVREEEQDIRIQGEQTMIFVHLHPKSLQNPSQKKKRPKITKPPEIHPKQYPKIQNASRK